MGAGSQICADHRRFGGDVWREANQSEVPNDYFGAERSAGMAWGNHWRHQSAFARGQPQIRRARAAADEDSGFAMCAVHCQRQIARSRVCRSRSPTPRDSRQVSISRHHRPQPENAGAVCAVRESHPHRRPRVVGRRKRHRQRVNCARHSLWWAAPRQAVCGRRLRRAAGQSHGKRIIRLCKRRFHRRAARQKRLV
ncbi:MAG: hypothetical protein ALAOOOJD_00017 [bacterium]|nr:hypothetical protein [bacterium]